MVGSAIAALDCALWDLRAKHNGLPLWRELGGSSNRVAAYASGLDMPLSDVALRTYYRDMAGHYGITAGKLKVGRDPDRDLERLAIVRDAIIEGSPGARPSLMIDANEFWTVKQAVRRISDIERHFDLVWAEEPVRRDDHRGLARVSQAIRASVATGENLSSIAEFVPLFLNGSADVDPGLGSGDRGHDRPANRRDERRAGSARLRSSIARAATPRMSPPCCPTT